MSGPSLRLFAQACLGVVVGVLFAVAIARLAFPADGRATAVPDGMLSWTLPNIWLKPREKGFYVLALALGGMFGYFAIYRILPGRITARNLWLTLIVSVPVVNLIIARTLGGASFLIPGLVALGLGTVLATLICKDGEPLVSTGPYSAAASAIGPKLWPYFVILVLMTLL